MSIEREIEEFCDDMAKAQAWAVERGHSWIECGLYVWDAYALDARLAVEMTELSLA